MRPLLKSGAVLLFTWAASACSRSAPPSVAATPVPKVVEAIAPVSLPPREAEPTWTPDPELVAAAPDAAPTAPPSATPRPTVDSSAIPSLERPIGPPAGVNQHLAGGPAQVGRLGLDQADFKYPVYIERVVLIISLNWFKPRQAAVSPVVPGDRPAAFPSQTAIFVGKSETKISNSVWVYTGISKSLRTPGFADQLMLTRFDGGHQVVSSGRSKRCGTHCCRV